MGLGRRLAFSLLPDPVVTSAGQSDQPTAARFFHFPSYLREAAHGGVQLAGSLVGVLNLHSIDVRLEPGWSNLFQ